jgi:thiamine-phosphate pyrophosphorylase
MQKQHTAAAERAAQHAKSLAHSDHVGEITPCHILAALAAEESHAAQILSEHGLTSEVIDQELTASLAIEQESIPPKPSFEVAETGRADIAESRAYTEVWLEAFRQAALGGRYAAVGSEHLLFGLCAVNSPAAELLQRFGLDAATIVAKWSDTQEALGEPIPVDFSLDTTNSPSEETTQTLRILDAAANRAREGLRVVEDYTRFALDDTHLTNLLKDARHALSQILQTVADRHGPSALVASRDTTGDVGTNISTEAETHRETATDVVRANAKRVQEAARTLEEYGKVVSPNMAIQLEAWRYNLYTIEKAVLTTLASRHRLEDRCLYLLVTASLCQLDIEQVVRGALEGGVDVVQLREKEMTDRDLLSLAKRVRGWTREAGALFIMNDRPDLALLAGADGVHVGQDELSVSDARKIVGPDRLVGVSTHSIEQARRAVLDGADYLGVGPTYPSGTKNFTTDEIAGLRFVQEVAAEITLPWFAIGGISAENIEQITATGAQRIAVSGCVCNTQDVRQAARQLRNHLDQIAT